MLSFPIMGILTMVMSLCNPNSKNLELIYSTLYWCEKLSSINALGWIFFPARTMCYFIVVCVKCQWYQTQWEQKFHFVINLNVKL
jgi:hypothetical protein